MSTRTIRTNIKHSDDVPFQGLQSHLLPGGHLVEEAVGLPVGVDPSLVLVGREEHHDAPRHDVTQVVHDTPQLMHLTNTTEDFCHHESVYKAQKTHIFKTYYC